jgi:hypothetical protein
MFKISFYSFLGKIEQYVNYNPIGKRIIDLLIFLRIYYLLSDFLMKRQSRARMINPTDKMIQSREFFARNEEQLRQVASFLEDDESVDIFMKMIDFRCNSNVDNFPKQNRHMEEYFMWPFFSYSNSEVLIDGGAYDGDTISSFKKALKHYGGNYAKIIAFEPDTKNFKQLMKKHKEIVGFNCGLWESNTVMDFAFDLQQGSKIITRNTETNTCAGLGGGGGGRCV